MAHPDSAGIALIPGQTVRAEVIDHQPWGIFVRIVDPEGVIASVDASAMDSPSGSFIALPEERPSVGTEVTAVVQEVRRWTPPGHVRLSLRAKDLEEFRWRCDLCMTPTTLSLGGDGVAMDVKSAEAPGSHTIVAHRACLLDVLHPESLERARVTAVGYSHRSRTH
ncbi:hypothetical protein HDA32_005396 [Spinactinospora alkalitolerans]|uniref:S1 motif domain-containing protein n=1 Tax=Spinactinospora alkalitolerans TaxID=687207 RepID=A0A852U0C2_9ACTN|nr:S1 RNA-binding domain-containing protein [Spinactinospora alkalitolerans]NYE50276.1 hypothetical protein [Spinactinospora alkalitolerans]